MTEQSKRGRSQDRAKVAGGQNHETSYEAKKTGSSPAEVRSTIKQAGNSRAKVEQKLGDRKGPQAGWREDHMKRAMQWRPINMPPLTRLNASY